MTDPTNLGVDAADDGTTIERRQFMRRVGAGAVVAGGGVGRTVDPHDERGVRRRVRRGSRRRPTGSRTSRRPVRQHHLDRHRQQPRRQRHRPPGPVPEGLDQPGGAADLGHEHPRRREPAVAGQPPARDGDAGIVRVPELGANQRAFQGQGSITVGGAIGLVLVQHNQGGGNTAVGSITNYQQVTFTFNTVIQNLRFTINDLSGNTTDGNNQGIDFIQTPAEAPPNGYLLSGPYRDAVGFNRAITVTPGGLGDASNTTNLAGTGTFSNPLRRSANSTWPGTGSNHMNVGITMAGPLSSFTMRYATVGGWGTQWISISNMTFGLC